MSRGGSRNRSGPQPDPSSGRSDRRGLSFSALPNEGFQGEIPEWPLWPSESDEAAEREVAVWREAWRTPQAAAWSRESWRWPIVAEYCRLKAVVESNPASNAALVAQLHRYRDQIGLTPAGLRENGWQIAPVEIGSSVVDSSGSSVSEQPSRARDRLRSVASGG